MPSPELPRRSFLSLAAGTLAAAPFAAYPREQPPERPAETSRGSTTTARRPLPVKAISSANGLQATARAYELLTGGADTLLAAIAGVKLVEDDPADETVGYGGLPNEDGIVELDAAVMHGPTHRAGAVAALRNIRHPSEVARLVMERTDHVLLVGEGALRFARAHGFQEENLLTDRARKIWLYWKSTLSNRDDWLPPPREELDPDVIQFFKLEEQSQHDAGRPSAVEPKRKQQQPQQQQQQQSQDQRGPQSSRLFGRRFERPTGTIHCAAMSAAGDISCVTTTSGLAFKIPGRVGDSPIIGAGLYCDNAIGSCGSTGRGEANLQNQSSFAAVELMRGGMPPKEAGLEVLKRIAAHTEPRLKDEAGRPDFNLKFYLLSKTGEHAGVSMWGPAEFAVTDEKGSRLEPCAFLYERGK